MSEHAERFISHLIRLNERDERGAMAALRHSLAFAPGTHVHAFPYVEPFVPPSWHEQDGRRLALYAVAGLFAMHPLVQPKSFAAAFADLMRKRESTSPDSAASSRRSSTEQRFLNVLSADAENIVEYLRHGLSLLRAEGIGFDYLALLEDLMVWMNRHADPAWLDRRRQRWARDFYRAQGATEQPSVAD